ncbi:MAG: S41 family peptidase, partial [Bacteroidota bacterium]
TKSRTISLPAIRYTSFKTKNAKLPRKSIEHRRFVFRVIEDSIAYMSVPSFGRDGFDYPSFYRSSFRSMDSLGISHLILDLQANGGGTEGNENLLFSYLTDQRVQKYREVSMLPGPYEGNKTDEDFIFDKWQSKEGRAVRGEFTLYSDYLSDLGYEKPAVADIFHGKLYVLISGATFSGGAEMSSLVKMTERGLFIGEETGGAYEGNVSGYSEEVRLPHSRILVDIPTVHFQINVRPAVRGRGVMPDKVVARYWEDYSMNRNAKLEAALALIRQGGMMD